MRLQGSYSTKSPPVRQLDHQIEPFLWKAVDGYKLPVRGPFTQVTADRGAAVFYVSQPGEVPLYISTTPGKVHWSEQSYTLPGKFIRRINQGEAVVWTPYEVLSFWHVEELPRPAITRLVPTLDEAIAQYQQRIIHACRLRIGNAKRVAVAQSGGLDSLLITWALTQCGVEIVPLTVCTSKESLDFIGAMSCCQKLGLDPIPLLVKQADLDPLTHEALLCLEDAEGCNVRMAIGNLLMAKKCRELGIDLIFTGHGQDDVHGKGTLVKGVLAQQEGTEAERWRDARWLGTAATAGMLKMFASTFRRYGVHVRHPYYDSDLLDWAFAQQPAIIPIDFKKGFVHQVAAATLPPGEHLKPVHSVGYLTGSGLSLKSKLLAGNPTVNPKSLRAQLAEIRKLPLSERIALHQCESTVDIPSKAALSSN